MPCRRLLALPFAAALAWWSGVAPACAIVGGSVAGRTGLTAATVGIGTLLRDDDEQVGFSRCSGVLIGRSLVLTAAHCVAGDPLASAVVLYAGSRPVSPAIRVTTVLRYRSVADDLPAEYAGLVELSLDTAVLRLAKPVQGRTPIRVGGSGRPPAGLRIAGAGLSGEGLGTLKTARLDPVAITSTGLIVAAAREGAAVCRGDSGGPVVADGRGGPVLWGVASAVLTRGGPCGRVVVIAPASPRV